MYKYDDISHVHLEPTTVCNARCPMCARNANGAPLPSLPAAELRLDDVQAIFPREFCARLDGFDLCGAYGDPAAARDLLGIVAHVRAASGHCRITLYTNGGLRPAQWWARLAAVMGENGLVVFAIDGLDETNAIHRQDVEFSKVMRNARAYIGAGGRSRWEFLAFRHNENQVDSARALSRDMGFTEFSVKKSGRFLEGAYDYVPELAQGDLTHFPIHDRHGAVTGYLEPAQSAELSNATVRNYSRLLEHYGSLDALFSKTPIECRVLDSRSVFVDAQGAAFPCCWVYVQATRPQFGKFPKAADRQVFHLLESCGGPDSLNARKIGLRAAVESKFFAAVRESWSCGSVETGRLRVCARACGVDFPAYFDQFAEEHLLPRSLQAPPPNEDTPII